MIVNDTQAPSEVTNQDYYKYRAPFGLNEEVVRKISAVKNEPDWMLEIRLQALEKFLKMPLPTWGVDLSELNFDEISYYLQPVDKPSKTWDDIPNTIKDTFEKLGIPQAEREFLAGIKSQYDSETIYGSIKKELSEKGVIFLSLDEALVQYPDLVKKYFGTLIPMGDNKFAALNTAVWSGGVFIFVPAGVVVDLPLQSYFRINSKYAGQFERTLLVIEKGARLNYIEGCSAPSYSEAALHAAVVEIFVEEEAVCQYITVQNWSDNVYNLVTKRSLVKKNAKMFWTDGNLGSKVTMKYPACVLVGEGAYGQMLSVALGNKAQHLDTGAKMFHLAPNTRSQIIAKTVVKNGGRSDYRGLVNISPKAVNTRCQVQCDALILDSQSRSDTYPENIVANNKTTFQHEATVSLVNEEQVFYLMSRGLTSEQAQSLIVCGFLTPIIKDLPMEYATEFNKLIALEIES